MLRLLSSNPDLIPPIFIARIYNIIDQLKKQVFFYVSRETLKYLFIIYLKIFPGK